MFSGQADLHSLARGWRCESMAVTKKGGSDVCHVSGRISYHITRFLCVWKWSTPPKCTCFYNFFNRENMRKIWENMGKYVKIWKTYGNIMGKYVNIWKTYGKNMGNHESVEHHTWEAASSSLKSTYVRRTSLCQVMVIQAVFLGFPWADSRSTVHIKTLIHS